GDLFGMVERTNGESDAVGRLEGERRAAFGTEAAQHVVGRAEALWLVARPCQAALRHGGKRRVKIAERLLAHAAMADRSVGERALDPEAHAAALAAAGVDRLVVEAHRDRSSVGGELTK